MKKKWWIALGVVGALSIAAALAYEPLLRHLVLTRAREGGVIFSRIDTIGLGWGTVTLEGVAFTLDGVEGLEGEAAAIDLSRDGLTPTAITAREMRLELVGSAVDLLLGLGRWTDRHPELWRLPADVSDVTLRWRPAPDADPWLSARGARVIPTAHGAKLEAERAQILGVGVGRVGAAWDGEGARAAFGFGEDDLEGAPLRAVIHHGERPARLVIDLDPVRVADLAGPLAMILPVPDIRASGKADLTLFDDGRIEGPIDARFDGYRVPVPRELGAFVFGDTTTMKTHAVIDAAFEKVALRDVAVTHGAVKLAGSGTIDRQGDEAAIEMVLKGNLGCADLAAAATRTHVEGELGRVLGGLAGKALQGSVGFTLTLTADTRNLLAAKVRPVIGVGCGLRPLSLEDLPKLPDDFPKLPEGLPKLPEGFPKLPGLRER